MKILTVTTLYPNAQQPNHGIFVENRLRHLVQSGEVSAQVIAPVPWFPWKSKTFGRYARYSRVPKHEVRHGLTIYHPRYLAIPKVGMSVSPLFLYRAYKKAALALCERGGDFDLIDAHYFYPDGVAAVLLARALDKPVVITGRGTDLNLIPSYAVPRRWIRWAGNRADGLIAVSQALKNGLLSLVGSKLEICVLANGVDLAVFKPHDQTAMREKYGLSGPVILSVGNLVQLKGHDLVIRAVSLLDKAVLLVVGDGPERTRLEHLALSLGLGDRIRFLGVISHQELPELYSAADVLVLASEREGWPNVLLESMACGTPVVVTGFPSAPEIVNSPAAGRIAKTRTPEAIAEAVEDVLHTPPSQDATRQYAEQHDWKATTNGQVALFQDILKQRNERRT